MPGAEVDCAIECSGVGLDRKLYGRRLSGVGDAMEVRFPSAWSRRSAIVTSSVLSVVQERQWRCLRQHRCPQPSERDPSATLRLAEIFSRAGLRKALLTFVLAARRLWIGLVVRSSRRPPASALLARRPRKSDPHRGVQPQQARPGIRRGQETTWWSCRRRPRPCGRLGRIRRYGALDSAAWRFQWWSPRDDW